MPQPMYLSLSRDMSGNAARILNILMAVEHFPYCLWLWPGWVPHVHREYKRVASGIIVEDYFARSVRENPAIPIELAIDADCRKRRRQRARCHDVSHRNRRLKAVEIPHFAAAHFRGAHRQPGCAMLDQIEVHQLRERAFERCCRIEAGLIRSERIMCAQKGPGVRFEKPRYSAEQRRAVRGRIRNPRPGGKRPEFLAPHPRPELLQLIEPILGFIAGNETGIDRSDRAA